MSEPGSEYRARMNRNMGVGAAVGAGAGAVFAAGALAAGPIGWLFFAGWVAGGGMSGATAGMIATANKDS